MSHTQRQPTTRSRSKGRTASGGGATSEGEVSQVQKFCEAFANFPQVKYFLFVLARHGDRDGEVIRAPVNHPDFKEIPKGYTLISMHCGKRGISPIPVRKSNYRGTDYYCIEESFLSELQRAGMLSEKKPEPRPESSSKKGSGARRARSNRSSASPAAPKDRVSAVVSTPVSGGDSLGEITLSLSDQIKLLTVIERAAKTGRGIRVSFGGPDGNGPVLESLGRRADREQPKAIEFSSDVDLNVLHRFVQQINDAVAEDRFEELKATVNIFS